MPQSKPEENGQNGHAHPASGTDVYAVFGVEPEVQAYAMAKYSRSSLSMKESLAELSQQRAEKFLNTFYFQYGHRSIADLAHIAMAVERLSLLAAIVLEDEQRWDGQERSTRYQDFSHPDYYTPDFGDAAWLKKEYRDSVEFLFGEYRYFSAEMFRYLVDRTPRPPDVKEDAYDRTLRARAFDIARYLLPLATNTSLGQIVNARTLETQISRLLTDPRAEVRGLGLKLKEAANTAAYNVHGKRIEEIAAELEERDSVLAQRLRDELLKDVRVAPTLVKYADPNAYLMETRRELGQAALELMGTDLLEAAPEVDLLDDEPVEVEIATTLLYEQSRFSYRQIRRTVEALSAQRRQEIIELGTRHRGAHDELLKAFSSGQKFRFDILMDIGGFRDMHRHRRCVQIHQDFVSSHGFDTPTDIIQAGLAERYTAAMRRAEESVDRMGMLLQAGDSDHNGTEAQYLLPLAYRKRTLFKMDFAEALYISELRTGPAGHFSYRNIAYKMYETVAQRHPELAKYFRVHDVRQPVDLLNR